MMLITFQEPSPLHHIPVSWPYRARHGIIKVGRYSTFHCVKKIFKMTNRHLVRQYSLGILINLVGKAWISIIRWWSIVHYDVFKLSITASWLVIQSVTVRYVTLQRTISITFHSILIVSQYMTTINWNLTNPMLKHWQTGNIIVFRTMGWAVLVQFRYRTRGCLEYLIQLSGLKISRLGWKCVALYCTIKSTRFFQCKYLYRFAVAVSENLGYFGNMFWWL